MSGEARIVRGALVWGAVATVPAACLAFALRGSDGAVSAVIACGMVLVNAALAAAMSALAGRISTMAAAMISLPSFAIRMLLIFTALAALQGASFIDRPTFALTFGLAVTVVLALESRGWRRTPWLANTFGAVPPTSEERP